jgi:DNA invertase Pin-like site-specific DNA recombinase
MNDSKTTVLLVARALANEDSPTIEKKLAALARVIGLRVPYDVVRVKLDPAKVAEGAVVVSDSPIRFADSPQHFLQVVAKLLVKRCRIVICDDAAVEPLEFSAHETVISFLHGLPALYRSSRIRQSLHARKSAGGRLGRQPLSDQLKQAVVDEFRIVGSIRGVSRSLKSKGIEVSRSSVLRILRNERVK